MIAAVAGDAPSTAMVHIMVARGYKIDFLVHYRTGWEFQESIEAIDRLKDETGLQLVLGADVDGFDDIATMKDGDKGFVGWPRHKNRWCTLRKRVGISAAIAGVGYAGEAVAFGRTYDERDDPEPILPRASLVFPLIDYKMSLRDCIDKCFALGYDFGGLYEKYSMAKCYCCPFYGKSHARKLRTENPELWSRMIAISDKIVDTPYCDGESVNGLDTIFLGEEVIEYGMKESHDA